MASLDILPEDVILAIVSHMDRRDSMSLRLVCRHLSVTAAAHALSCLPINLHHHGHITTTEKLEAYARRTTAGAFFARTVSISSLAFRTVEWKGLKEGGGHPESMSVLEQDKNLRELLLSALQALNIRSLEWYTSTDDPPWAVDVISRHLATHPVPDLSLNFKNGISTPGVLPEGFGGLQRLTLNGMDIIGLGLVDPRLLELCSKIKKIIEASPKLDTLIVGAAPIYSAAECKLDLHHFLPDEASTSASGPLAIKSLSLRLRHIVLQDQTFSHLQFLENLSITSYGRDSGKLGQVWSDLRTKGIKLKKITTNVIDIEIKLLEYLEFCHDALTELTLADRQPISYTSFSRSSSNATHFFSHVLPKLAPKLQVLHIRAPEPDGWCFSHTNYSAFANCKKLEELSVSIIDLTQPHSRPTQLLLEKAKAELPRNIRVHVFNACWIPMIG